MKISGKIEYVKIIKVKLEEKNNICIWYKKSKKC